jgi:hypothetical protein
MPHAGRCSDRVGDVCAQQVGIGSEPASTAFALAARSERRRQVTVKTGITGIIEAWQQA